MPATRDCNLLEPIGSPRVVFVRMSAFVCFVVRCVLVQRVVHVCVMVAFFSGLVRSQGTQTKIVQSHKPDKATQEAAPGNARSHTRQRWKLDKHFLTAKVAIYTPNVKCCSTENQQALSAARNQPNSAAILDEQGFACQHRCSFRRQAILISAFLP